MRARIAVLIGSIVVCLLGGCESKASSASACTLPTKVKLSATERINPDSSGVALPTVVRLYQLKEIVRVEESDFSTIWETPEEALGQDLLGVQEFTLFPGQATSAPVALGPSAKFLVGVAIFRRPTGSQWRSILPLPPSEKLCGAYAEGGVPDPAVVFRFDQYLVEGKSRLLQAGGDHELPRDVAPDSNGEEKRR
jgi:type VI secretion system protein VasD